MFKYGFEAKLNCPFSRSYMKKLTRYEKYSYVSTCPCLDVDYKDINELVNHAKWNRCDNHRVLYEYLRYFKQVYDGRYNKKSASKRTTNDRK